MEAIVWILSVYHNACILPLWSFSCPFGAVCLFDFIFQGLLKEMRWLQMLREGSIWYRHPGSLPRGSSNSAGESPKIALPESWPPLSTPQDCNDTSFLSGNPQTVRLRKQWMPHFPVWLGKTANTTRLDLFLCVAQITFTTQSYPVPLSWHNGSLDYLAP